MNASYHGSSPASRSAATASIHAAAFKRPIRRAANARATTPAMHVAAQTTPTVA